MKYTLSHEWIQIQDNIAIVGISDFVRKEFGEIVYVELPSVGKIIDAGEEVVVLESTKSAVDIYSPVSGIITAVNLDLQKDLSLINFFAETSGWLFQIKLRDLSEYENFLQPEEYRNLIQI